MLSHRALVLCLALAACSTSNATRLGSAIYPPTEPSDVLVFLDRASIDREYEVIGMVSSQHTAGWTFTNVDEGAVMSDLREEAASIGAHAIVLEFLDNDSVPWAVQGAGGSSSLDRKTGRAVAIRFRESPDEV